MELSNPYQLHRTIMKGFPDNLKESNTPNRILYRVNFKSSSADPTVLIQSSICPDWTPLISTSEFLSRDPLFKQFEYPKFNKFSIYRFRLYGNPSKKVEGKRVGMYKTEDHIKWLKRKAEIGGFKVLRVSIIKNELIKAKAHKNSKPISILGVQFEGMLQVINPEKFENTLKSGIGSAKAFGCGLLSLAKI